MIKKGFIMKVYEDKHEEYKMRHDKLWPEMKEMLKEHGAIKYSIFLDENKSLLFSYLEIEDESIWNEVEKTEINLKWWDYMKDIMETNTDNSPKTIELIQVFDL